MIPFPVSHFGPRQVALAYVANAADTSNTSTYTFTSQPLRTAGDQKILICVSGVGVSSRSLTSATVDGVSASILVQATGTGSGNDFKTAILLADGNIGTTGSVVLNWSGTMGNSFIGIYRMGGNASNTPTTTATGTLSAGAVTASLNVPARGIVLANAMALGTSGVTSTWNSAVTKDYDPGATDGASVISFSGASKYYETAQTSLSVSDTIGGSGLVGGSICAVTFAP